MISSDGVLICVETVVFGGVISLECTGDCDWHILRWCSRLCVETVVAVVFGGVISLDCLVQYRTVILRVV